MHVTVIGSKLSCNSTQQRRPRRNGYAAGVDHTNRIYRGLVQVEVDMKPPAMNLLSFSLGLR